MLRDLDVPAKTNCKAREYMSLCKLGKFTVLVRFEPQPTQVPKRGSRGAARAAKSLR